jgi:hypothetical protein
MEKEKARRKLNQQRRSKYQIPICKIAASVAMNHEPAEEFMTGVCRQESKDIA